MNNPFIFIIFSLASVLFLRLPCHFFLKNLEVKDELTRMVMQQPVVISATANGIQPNVTVGYCQTGQSTVTFTNLGLAGNPAQSTIKIISLGVGLSDAFSLQDNAFTLTGIRIAGVNISGFQAMNSLAFTTDPDGPGGLSDADGDGFFDDLAMGQSVEITAFYSFNCSLAGNLNINENCRNNFATTFNARMAYEEQDGTQQTYTLADYLQPSHEALDVETLSDPDAFLGTGLFYITMHQTRSVRFFQNNCNNGQFVVKVPLVSGITAVLDSTHFIKNGNVSIPLLSASVSNDTLVLIYNASFSSFLSGDYEFRLALSADCTFPVGPSTFNLTVEHFCPDCNCRHRWFCGEITGPQLHATAPPCPAGVVPVCSNSLKTLAFEANRTTFGFSNANFTSPFNPALANKKVALGCDSVQVKMTGTVGSISVNDSIGVVINYGNPDGTLSSDEIFLFGSGVLHMKHNGVDFNCPVEPSNLTVTSNAGQKNLRFDMAGCLASLGFSLNPGDSLTFTGNFYVNPDGPFSQSFKQVPNFRGWFFNTINGTDVSCDQFGEAFTLGKSSAVYVFPNTMTGMPAACSDGELTWRLFVPDNEFADFFGNELRQAAKLDSIVFDFDPGILQGFENIQVTASFPGHPVFGNNHFPVQSLSAFPNGHYVARFDTLAYTPSLNVVKEYIFELKVKMTPSCASSVSSVAGNGFYSIDSKVYYRGRYYASTIGNGSCVAQTSENALTTLSYKTPPVFSLEPLTAAVDTLTNGVASWEVQLCNISASDAGLVWMAAEALAGTASISSIQNISNQANPVALSLQPYGQHIFVYTPVLAANQCVILRINATVNNCADSQIQLRSGWNCGPFSLPNWTPDLYPPCQEQNLNLSLINLDAAPLQVYFTNVESVCETGGTEAVSITGRLTSGTALPSDVFLLKFISDENGDGAIQPGEPVLGQTQVNGAVSPSNPLVFNQNIQISPEQACRILVVLEANNIDLCGTFIVALPAPQFRNGGADQVFCSVPGSILNTSIGELLCTGSAYQYSWSALSPATLQMLDNPSFPNPAVTLDPLAFQGQTLAFVLETQRSGCQTSSFDTVLLKIPVSNNGFFDQEQVTMIASNCQSKAQLCVNALASSLSGLTIMDNGLNYTGTISSCGSGFFALNLAPGAHSIVVTDTVSGCTDTIQANVSCTSTDTINIDILLNQTMPLCLDSVELTGPVVSLTNSCPDGSFVTYQLLDGGCLNITGNGVGQEFACLVACDAAGFCDTTILNIQVSSAPGITVTDTVFILVETGTYCPGQNLLPGNIVSVEDICPDKNGDQVIFNISGGCVSYYGIEVGIDTACVRLEDEFGNVALVYLIVTVVKTTPETYCDTLYIGETGSYCLSISELPGQYDSTSFKEICPGVHTGNVSFSFVPGSRCVFFTGEALGKDTACVIVCDNFGYCDTTYFCLLVVEYPLLPELGNDTATTLKNTPVVINFLANDTLFGGVVDLYILDQPVSGVVVLNLDNSFTYTPYDPFCARWDEFSYVACNPNGCDTATVSIFIECIELTVFTAVSPNNDGVNDVFYIAKIEDFPENRLRVYNRWGNLVFETTEYENTWPGTWGDDTELPDGTYFYILEWTDAGLTTVQRGYIEIFR